MVYSILHRVLVWQLDLLIVRNVLAYVAQMNRLSSLLINIETTPSYHLPVMLRYQGYYVVSMNHVQNSIG